MRANYIQFLSLIVAGFVTVSSDVRAEIAASEFGDSDRELRIDTIAEQYSGLDTPDLPGGGTSGACCQPDGGCTIEATHGDCERAGGVYRGDGSTCATAGCDPVCLSSGGGQLPDFTGDDNNGVRAVASDFNPTVGSRVADNFSTIDAGILTTLRWWGLYRDFGASMPCATAGGDSPDNFTVTFYEGSSLIPTGVLAGPFSLTPSVVDSGRQVLGHPVYQYTASGLSISLEACKCYYMEILNHTTGNCAWLWITGLSGDDQAVRHLGDGPYTIDDYSDIDFAWCIDIAHLPGASCDCEIPVACCLGGGSACVDTMGIADCVNNGGTFLGFQVSCTPGICEGACCISMTHACTLESEVDCFVAGGDFQGIGSECSPSPCGCATCPGDITGNGSVNGEDISGFAACLLSGGVNCGCGDVNGDALLDVDDIADFTDTLLTSTGACP